jgi:hypothetical protein
MNGRKVRFVAMQPRTWRLFLIQKDRKEQEQKKGTHRGE